MFLKPVIILGAPRSGTSLLQKIVREHPSFVSVPRESDIIWFKYCHPSIRNWEKEGIEDNQITSDIVADIRTSFENSALRASTWQRWSGLGLMNHPIASKIVRKVYSQVFKTFSTCRKVITPTTNQTKPRRLVDKSVHCPLWLNLVEAVFPDSLYVHITRDARQSIDSMIDGWLDPDRFNTFEIHEPLNITGYLGSYWNFALPQGWRDYIDASIEEVTVFQWKTIQESILSHVADPARQGRYLHIRLEDLVQKSANTLDTLAEFIQVSEGFPEYSDEVPVVNAGKRNKEAGKLLYPEAIEKVLPQLQTLQKHFGYS